MLDGFLPSNSPIWPYCDTVDDRRMTCSPENNALVLCNLNRLDEKLSPEYQASKVYFKGLVNIKKIQKSLDTIHPTHPTIYPKQNFWKISKVINHEYLNIEARTKEKQRIYNVIDVRMLAQKRNKIMYKNMFSIFFNFLIGHLTHPPISKVFLDFLNFLNLVLFTWPLS